MAILIKNRNSILECSTENKTVIDDRVSETGANIGEIRDQIMLFHSTVTASTDNKIKNLKKASSFPVADIISILAANPNCKYLRVYNGFTADDKYIAYLAPISDAFDSYIENPSSIISVCCCQCNPCTKDKILNP